MLQTAAWQRRTRPEYHSATLFSRDDAERYDLPRDLLIGLPATRFRAVVALWVAVGWLEMGSQLHIWRLRGGCSVLVLLQVPNIAQYGAEHTGDTPGRPRSLLGERVTIAHRADDRTISDLNLVRRRLSPRHDDTDVVTRRPGLCPLLLCFVEASGREFAQTATIGHGEKRQDDDQAEENPTPDRGS